MNSRLRSGGFLEPFLRNVMVAVRLLTDERQLPPRGCSSRRLRGLHSPSRSRSRVVAAAREKINHSSGPSRTGHAHQGRRRQGRKSSSAPLLGARPGVASLDLRGAAPLEIRGRRGDAPKRSVHSTFISDRDKAGQSSACSSSAVIMIKPGIIVMIEAL